ncbi:MAG TPA: serine hydrolase [Humibacillus sp.]|nr:serine hydrolase [Humibacillus sp.]
MPSSFCDLDARLAAVAAHDPSASVSVWLGDLAGRRRWSHRAEAPHYAASTMKLPLVVAVQRRVVRGELDLETPHPVRNAFASVHDGSPFTMDIDDDQDPDTWAAVGGTRTLRELTEHAITHSGNLATNLLLDLVGRDEVAAVLRLARCSPTTVVGRGIEDVAARQAGITNTVTAADLGLVMAAVGRRDPALGGRDVCEPVEQMFSRQQHLDQIPAGLPRGTPTASKSGWIPGVSHDVALVRPVDEEPFVLAICTTIELGEHEAAAFVASVAADVWAVDHARDQAHDLPEVQR